MEFAPKVCKIAVLFDVVGDRCEEIEAESGGGEYFDSNLRKVFFGAEVFAAFGEGEFFGFFGGGEFR